MNTKNGQAEVHNADRLPMFHRTIRLPARSWQAVKGRSAEDEKAIRWVIDDALGCLNQPQIISISAATMPGSGAILF